MELSAIKKVFSTPELLETILINLPPQDVLVNAQRVSRTWTAIVSSSPSLQQHLFFTSTHHSPVHEPDWTKNPLLEKKFPVWFGDIRATTRYYMEVDGYNDHPGPYKAHPFHDIRSIKKTDWRPCSDAYSRPEASWRRMLVMQPGVRLFKIVHAKLFRKRWRRTREGREYGPGEGLRMGFLFDFVIEEIDETWTRFGIQWNMFEQEDDTGAREYEGMDDSFSIDALIERREEKDSMTLIFYCAHTNSNGTLTRRSGWELADQFKSKAEDKAGEAVVKNARQI